MAWITEGCLLACKDCVGMLQGQKCHVHRATLAISVQCMLQIGEHSECMFGLLERMFCKGFSVFHQAWSCYASPHNVVFSP